MSLSRPARFPLLMLPWLCIRCVIQNLDELVIIYFATISNRTRRIVKSSNYPLKEIGVYPSGNCMIRIKERLGKAENEKNWYFMHHMSGTGIPLVLQKGSPLFLTSRHFSSSRGHYLESYTAVEKLDALKMGIEFMIDLFGCSIWRVLVEDNASELLRLGISTVKELFIHKYEPVDITNLKYLLEYTKVTDRYVIHAPIPANFSCDPQIFKCRKLNFAYRNSADWVTLELLCQLDVPQLAFWHHRFSKEDIVSYATHWINSENRKLEYVRFQFNNSVSQEDFKIDHLDPMPFDEKRRNKCPFVGGWKGKDMSSGMDILRQDGLLATFYVDFTSVIFYIWHKRFPDVVQP
ncbi:unnamed protein product [Caenorhabditis brenneri]